MVLGSHLSVAGGLEKAVLAAHKLRCGCLQVFVKNPRQWRSKPLTEEQRSAFAAAKERTGIATVVAHAGYLINLGSNDAAARRQSAAALIDEADRCDALGISLLVVHPGAAPGAAEPAALRNVVASLNEVNEERTGHGAIILLETTAGQGASLGHRLEHLACIRDGVRCPERIGVCLDTCHLFAAGYDFRAAEAYAALAGEIERVIGLASVKCVHLNDSKRELGSRVDRHEHIGKGKIGLSGFTHLVNDARFAGIPGILETPKGKNVRGTDWDKVNIKRLRGMMADRRAFDR